MAPKLFVFGGDHFPRDCASRDGVLETAIKTVTQNLCFGGVQSVYTHASQETGCVMRFGVFLPPQAASSRVPVLYWLSGLTCSEENFIVKAGAQRVAAALGLAIVVPDTSPRGLGMPGEGESYDFGLGAGFYVDATEAPWSRGYRMYSYITQELAATVAATFPVDPNRVGIFGHSMGGHGALTIAPGESVRIAIDFRHPFAGSQLYLLHCHNLEHEDGGMMLRVNVG